DDVFFEHYFRTGDLGKRDPDGSLFLQGRLKEMINVGGEKVSPHEIETAALHMSDVTEAAAYAMPHPTLGEQVGLSISVRSDLTSAAVKAHLNTQLASFKCPNMITILDQLPRLANAKVDRVLLKRNAETDWKARHTATDQKARRVATGSLAPDAASFEAQAVARHWAQILKCRAPDGEDDFFDMGGDSLTATQFLLALEKTLGREISPNQLFEAPTFSGLVASLTQNSIAPNTPSPRPVRFIQENTVGWPGQVVVPGGLLRGIGSLKPGHPLFWVSQAHQEVDAILNTMGKRRPLYVTGSLRLFKRRTEQDFEVIAQQLADEIMTVQPEGPIALGGFCGGAWVMHHTAERLVQLGRQIRVLISFDYWPARRVHVPTVHGMSHCDINSARTVYGNYSVAQDLLHQKGVLSLHFEGRHEFHAQNIAPHLPVLNNILDGVQTPPKPSPAPNGTWSLDQRRSAPKAKIKLRQRPHTYKPNGQATFELDVTNTSGTIWDPTEVSGLSVQIDLINLDGCMRKANVFFGAFDTPIPPGKTVTFPVKITFPNKRIPVWLVCCLASQGVTRFQAKSSGRCKKLVFPSLF
ncbi:MAG: phosphopantetheine-binding protein, partial [Paracoccaceae bacterium]